MPVISPSAFAPPVASRAANDTAAPVAADLRERIRRLERAHSAQRAGQAAVPLGVPAIDALLPEGGLLTGALHEIEAGPAPSGRVASHDGAALGFAAHLLGRFGASPPAPCCGAAARRARSMRRLMQPRSPPGSIRRAC